MSDWEVVLEYCYPKWPFWDLAPIREAQTQLPHEAAYPAVTNTVKKE